MEEDLTMDNYLYERYNYIVSDKMVSYNYLMEYDLRHANISILYGAGAIDKDLFDLLNTVPKQQREITIGMRIAEEKRESELETGKRISITENLIKEGIRNVKEQFVIQNHIQDHQIVRIANDALLIKPLEPIEYTTFPYGPSLLEFKIDGVYTSMVHLADIIILFNSESCAVDVKGINNNKVSLCEKFLTAICEIILYIEKGDLKIAKMKYIDFYKDYITLKLPIDYYRELNSGDGYKIKYNGFLTKPKTCRPLALSDQFDVSKLDISYNLYILREIYSIILSMS